MPKLRHKCTMLVGTPDETKPLGENDHLLPCGNPAANCHFCKQPFCLQHYLIHSSSCPEPKVTGKRKSVSRDEALDDPSEEVLRSQEEQDDNARREREQELRDDSL